MSPCLFAKTAADVILHDADHRQHVLFLVLEEVTSALDLLVGDGDSLLVR
jgi:hypothetical protein